MAVARIDNVWDLVDTCSRRLAVMQKTTTYSNNYILNTEKSIKKKLESTKRSTIEYSFTGGGICVKLDAVTFELFIYGCNTYFSKTNDQPLNYKKTTATDKDGNTVQYTYHIGTKETQTYTINAYLTKCSLLINGKNIERFIDDDIKEIHNIMSKTKINGVNIDVSLLNQALASKLEEALNELYSSEHNRKTETTKEVQKLNLKEAKCYKCKRNCKTRAALCLKGHWVHYVCDKLTDQEINSIEVHRDIPYICKVCKTSVNKKQLTKIDNTTCLTVQLKTNNQGGKEENETATSKTKTQKQSPAKLTAAETLLLEEKDNCFACSKILEQNIHTCSLCEMLFHDECIDKNDNVCYGCLGITKQRTVIDNPTKDSPSMNEGTTGHNTSPSPKRTKMSPTTINENDDRSNKSPTSTRLRTIETNNVIQYRNLEDAVNSENTTPKTTSMLKLDGKLTNNNNNSAKEMRQIELKLKKKEEQLKIKEAILNDSTSEKTKLLDRLFKAETRNLELENTVKTLYNKIETSENKPSSNTSNNVNSGSCDDLVIGIREKITKFVLNKVENELNKLQIGNEQNFDINQTQQLRRQTQWEPYSKRNEHYQPMYDSWPLSGDYQTSNSGAYHNIPSEHATYCNQYQQYSHYQQPQQMMFPTEHRYHMYGPMDRMGDGGSYHNVPSGLYGSNSTQQQYHQVTYDQPYYNNHYHMNNHQTANTMTKLTGASQMGDGGTYHNDPAGYLPEQNQYFAHDRDVCRSNLIEIQTIDHNYEQMNDIHSDQQSILEISYTHTDPLTKAQSDTPNSKLKSDSVRTNKTETKHEKVYYTKVGQPLYYSAPSSNYFLGSTQILPERHKMYPITSRM